MRFWNPTDNTHRFPRLCLTVLLGSMAAGVQAQTAQHYTVTPLTSNLASAAPTRDANLVNPWGVSRSSKGPWWIADNGTGLSTLYDGTGKTQSLVVTVPPADTSSTTGNPTGTIFNGDPTAFQIAPGKAAIFLFATEDGTISGWNPGVSSAAVIAVNQKGKSVFKGLTSATAQLYGVSQTLLYAADFKRGRVDVFDSSFKSVSLPRGSEREGRGDDEEGHRPFTDERLPGGYAPFNVQNIGGNLYVAFAKQGGGADEVHGAGLGYVDVFSPTGTLLLRLEHGAWFNAPWGLALAPTDFGVYSHDILVGQFGSGQVASFDPVTGHFKGMLMSASNQPIVISGLWALAFGNDAAAGPATSLYFTAGIDDEANGLFGTITAVENVFGNDN